MTVTADQRAALLSELCGRCLTPCAPNPAQGCVELSSLTVGQRGRIVGYRGEPNEIISRRLFDLGFASGADIELVGRAPFRGPLMFRVSGTDMLLRAREAARIVVRLEPASAARDACDDHDLPRHLRAPSDPFFPTRRPSPSSATRTPGSRRCSTRSPD